MTKNYNAGVADAMRSVEALLTSATGLIDRGSIAVAEKQLKKLANCCRNFNLGSTLIKSLHKDLSDSKHILCASLKAKDFEKVFTDERNAALHASGQNRNAAGADWEKIKYDQFGRPESSVHNARAGMISMGVSFKYDKFTRRTTSSHDWGNEPTMVGAELRATIARRLSEQYAIEVQDDKISSAISQIASANKHDSLIDSLESLPEWDKQERLDRWLIDYAGAADNIYHREAGHVWLVAAIARAYLPGVKFDSAIVLQGLQGKGKSTLLHILAGGKFFTDENIMGKANDSKHLIETTTGKWIVELGELAGMNRSTIEDVKAMISRTEDGARMAYGRETDHYLRRMVFAGTTNGERYLRDETGNRRFWPIITSDIDLTGMAANRDQLLAEAKLAFLAIKSDLERAIEGEVLEQYPLQLNDADSRRMAIAAQKDAFDLDTGWMGVLETMPEWLVHERSGVWYVPNNQMYKALDMSAKDWNIIASKRVKPIMEALGWELTQNQVYYGASNDKTRCWKRSDKPQTHGSRIPDKYL
jgi:GTPase SAR1 family protein